MKTTVCLGLLLLFTACAEDGLDPRVNEKVKNATVAIRTETATGTVFGAGYFAGNNVIVTSLSAVGLEARSEYGPRSVLIYFNAGVAGKEVESKAAIIGIDLEARIVFLKCTPPPNFQAPLPLELAENSMLKEKASVYSFSLTSVNPFNPAILYTKAIVSALQVKEKEISVIQVAPELRSESNGGPVVTMSGKVAGVTYVQRKDNTLFLIAADSFRKDLNGRVNSIALSNLLKVERRHQYDVEVSLFDPLERFSAVNYIFWQGASYETRPLDPKTGLHIYGAPSDGQKRFTVMKKDPATGTWKAKIDFSKPNELNIFSQLALRVGNSETLTAVEDNYQIIRSLISDPNSVEHLERKMPITIPPPDPSARPRLPRFKALSYTVATSVAQPLEATVEKDESGGNYSSLKAEVNQVTLEPGLLEIACPPSGNVIYAIFTKQSAIRTYEPTTMKLLGEIKTPEPPLSLWCDDELIVVACPESSTFLILNAKSKEVLQSVKTPELTPRKVFGRAFDGSILVGCQAETGIQREDVLCQVSKNGELKRFFKAWVEHLFELDEQLFVWECGNSLESSQANKRDNLIYQNKILENIKGNYRGSFATRNDSCVCLANSNSYVVSKDFTRELFHFKGWCVAEAPELDAYISVGFENHERVCKIFYASRSSGRIFRKAELLVEPNENHFDWGRRKYLFVRGHELAVFTYSLPFSKGTLVTIARCGPVKAGICADPWVRATTTPPASVVAGVGLSYLPAFEKPLNTSKTIYNLKTGPATAKVDPDSGALTWKPTENERGVHTIVIGANLDGVECVALSWTLEVK